MILAVSVLPNFYADVTELANGADLKSAVLVAYGFDPRRQHQRKRDEL